MKKYMNAAFCYAILAMILSRVPRDGVFFCAYGVQNFLRAGAQKIARAAVTEVCAVTACRFFLRERHASVCFAPSLAVQ